MRRNAIRIIMVVVVAFLAALVSMHQEWVEQYFPLGSQRSMNIDFGPTSASKSEAIDQLGSIATEHGATLVKAAADPNAPASSRIVYFFGNNVPTGYREGPIDWFDKGLTGQLISASEITDASLTGQYGISGPVEADRAIAEWVTGIGGGIQSSSVYSPWRSMLELAAKTGAGIAVIALSVLVIALLVAWFAALVRSRSLRVLAGVRPIWIHLDDVGSLARLAGLWLGVGYLCSLLWLLGWHGRGHLAGFAIALGTLALLFFVGMTAVAGALSVALAPTVAAIANRSSATPGLNRLAWALKAVSLVLVLASLPSMLTAMSQLQSVKADAVRWQELANVVVVNSNATDAASEMYEKQFSTLFAQAQEQHSSALAFPLLETITGSKQNVGPYQDIVMVDRQYLNWWGMDIPASNQETAGPLAPVSLEQLPEPLGEDIPANLEIWRADKTTDMEGISLFDYRDSASFPAPGSDGSGTLIDANRVLLLVVDSPATLLDVNNILEPALSSGHILFSDRDTASALIKENGLTDVVNSFDRVADAQLLTAQNLAQETRMRGAAAVLVLLALAFGLLASAQSWAAMRGRDIFALHTSGRSFLSISRSRLVLEVLTFALAAIGGGILARLMSNSSLVIIVATGVGTFVVYLISSALIYHYLASLAFRQTLHRTA